MLRRKAILILVAAAICVAATILFSCDPAVVRFYPRCPSKFLTGYDCPGCGSLRALHALLHGDLANAWQFNAALFIAIPAIIFFCFATRYRVGSIPWRICYSPLTPWIILFFSALWWLIRNLL